MLRFDYSDLHLSCHCGDGCHGSVSVLQMAIGLLPDDYSTRSHYWQVDGTISPRNANDSCKRIQCVCRSLFYAKSTSEAQSLKPLFRKKPAGSRSRAQRLSITQTRGEEIPYMIQRRTVRETSGRIGGKINMWNPLRVYERQLHKLYPDLPPQDLLLQHMGKNVSVNRDEFQRAKWFWGRRPNKLILSVDKSIRVGIFYILLLFTSMVVQNQTLAIDVIQGVAWIALAAIAVAVFVDISRYAQWKWDYCCAISRVFATLSQ
jgi:hypothetical protein